MSRSTHIACFLSVVWCFAVTQEVALISDVHYDSQYSTPLAFNGVPCWIAPTNGKAGCDSPAALMSGVVSDAVSAVAPRYTMVMGDWLRHRADLLGTTAMVSDFRTVATAFSALSTSVSPAPKLQGALGNNDFYPDDTFDVTATNPVLRQMSQVLQDQSLLTASEAATFSVCGHYSRTLSADYRVVTLNTFVWSMSITPKPTGSDPCGMLNFLRNELFAARDANQRVVLVGHIPPTVNLYRFIQQGLGCTTCDFFDVVYQTQYEAIVESYRDVVVAQLYGHMHTFFFVATARTGVPLIVAPALSPIFGNYPSYLRATLSRAGLTSMRLRYTVTGTLGWTWGDDVATAFRTGNLTFAGLRAATSGMTRDDVFTAFTALHGGGNRNSGHVPSPCAVLCRLKFACAMQHSTTADTVGCVLALNPDVETTDVASSWALRNASAPATYAGAVAGCAADGGLIAIAPTAGHRELQQTEGGGWLGGRLSGAEWGWDTRMGLVAFFRGGSCVYESCAWGSGQPQAGTNMYSSGGLWYTSVSGSSRGYVCDVPYTSRYVCVSVGEEVTYQMVARDCEQRGGYPASFPTLASWEVVDSTPFCKAMLLSRIGADDYDADAFTNNSFVSSNPGEFHWRWGPLGRERGGRGRLISVGSNPPQLRGLPTLSYAFGEPAQVGFRHTLVVSPRNGNLWSSGDIASGTLAYICEVPAPAPPVSATTYVASVVVSSTTTPSVVPTAASSTHTVFPPVSPMPSTTINAPPDAAVDSAGGLKAEAVAGIGAAAAVFGAILIIVATVMCIALARRRSHVDPGTRSSVMRRASEPNVGRRNSRKGHAHRPGDVLGIEQKVSREIEDGVLELS